MRQAQITLLILALLAAPLGLVETLNSARQVSCPICGTMRHGAAGTCQCPMHRKAQLPDFSLAAPLAPTAPLPFFKLSKPSLNRFALIDLDSIVPAGVFARPFIPPRS